MTVYQHTLFNIENDFHSYQRMISFYHEYKDCFLDTIELELIGWFSANNSAFLGSLLNLLQNQGLNEIKVNAGTAESILRRNQFLSFFGQEASVDLNNTAISYKVFTLKDERYFNHYVSDELLAKSAFPSMTKALRKKLTESIYEVFINALMHSETDRIFT